MEEHKSPCTTSLRLKFLQSMSLKKYAKKGIVIYNLAPLKIRPVAALGEITQ